MITLAVGAGPRGAEAGEDRTARGVPVVRRHRPLAPSVLGRRRHLPETMLQAAARERYGLVIVGEEEFGGGPLLTRRFLEALFRAAPCPVMALRA